MITTERFIYAFAIQELMTLSKLPTLEELGVVGEALRRIYFEGQRLDYIEIKQRFEKEEQCILGKHLPVLQLFNPKGERTKNFVDDLANRSLTDLGLAVEATAEGRTISQIAVATGIMRTRLNLPFPIYRALEETCFPAWRGLGLASRPTNGMNGEITYARTLYAASQRYASSLCRLEKALGQSRLGHPSAVGQTI